MLWGPEALRLTRQTGCEVEIEDIGAPVSIEQQVAWVDVLVNNSTAVKLPESSCDLHGDAQHLGEGQWALVKTRSKCLAAVVVEHECNLVALFVEGPRADHLGDIQLL